MTQREVTEPQPVPRCARGHHARHMLDMLRHGVGGEHSFDEAGEVVGALEPRLGSHEKSFLNCLGRGDSSCSIIPHCGPPKDLKM